MPANKIHTIKDNIKTILDGLVTTGTLKEVQVDDYKKGLLSRDFTQFPTAILTTPTLESTAATNVQNLRTYTFEIIVVMNAENITSSFDVEDLIENIINQFDNDPSLKAGGATGAADGGVEPSSSTPEAVTSGSKNYIVFGITVRAKAIRDLSFV